MNNNVVRILTTLGNTVGTGFLVSSKHIITCAHVVGNALDFDSSQSNPPQDVIRLDFPLLPDQSGVVARVVAWAPVTDFPQIGVPEDIAILEILGSESLPQALQPAVLIDQEPKNLTDREIRMIGFPDGVDHGEWIRGHLRGVVANGWMHLDPEPSGRMVRPGYSGTPVFDANEGKVIGMTVSSQQQNGVTVAYAIPINSICKLWSELTNQSCPINPSGSIQHPLHDGSLSPFSVVIPAGNLFIEHSGISIPIEKFTMGMYLITFEEFDKFCVLCNKDKPTSQDSGRGKQPVVNVSYQSAKEYCEWLSSRTGKVYRLPTTKEWLYVAKEGFRDLSCPKSKLNDYIWHKHNSGNKPHPVGKNKPNRLGLYDVLGNVWEWVAPPHSDSQGIAIGGCHRMDLDNLLGCPQQNANGNAHSLIGFRVVVELE